MSDDDLGKEAEERHAMHAEHASSRPFNDGYELTGLRAERCFERWSGVSRDHALRPGGDGGRDFVLRLHVGGGVIRDCVIDVKGSRSRGHLLVEKGHARAHIFVQAHIDDHLGDCLIGWATRDEVLAAPLRSFAPPPYDVVSYALPEGKLRKMRELEERRR
jgi:hypothetical protein